MANATMTTFTVEDENGNQVTYDVADAKARADIDEILLNGTGGIKEETDPTVPAWAKQPNKPTYTAAEVNALPANTKIPTVPTNISAFTNDAGYLVDTDLPYVTPQMFGAKADGVTDDTAAINAAINAIPDGGTLFFPNGTYLVKETDSSKGNDRIAIRIDNRQNITLLLSDHAVLKHAPSTSAYYRTIRINNSKNVTIRGGYLVGDTDTHTPTYSDDGTSIVNTHGYGIRVIDSEDITIDGVDVSKYYGDPIVLCSELSPYQGCKNVVIKNCIIHDSLRNGITVTSCQNLLVKDCEIFNITGALPMAGIDIEGEYDDALNEDIIIEGCSFHDNGEWSVTAQLTCHNVQIKNCQLLTRFSMAETATGVVISDSVLTSGVIKSDLVLRNCDVYSLGLGNGDVSVIGCHFFTDENSLHNVCVEAANAKARFIGCDFTSPDTQNNYFYTVRANAQAEMIAFSNCTFHLKALKASSFGNMGVSEFVGCTFVGELDTQSLMWLNISGTKTSLNECVFDATALTSYTGQTALITINATDTTVKNCMVKAASKVCAFAFNCSGTGEIYFINNILPMWENVGIMPASAKKLVLAGNVVSTSESEILFTAEDKEKLDSIDEIISESGFPTEAEMKAYVDNEIAELKSAGIQQSPLFANSVDECIDTTRLYVLPNGYIYSYMAVEKEVEEKPSYTNLLPLAVNADGTDYVGANGEDGYKTGYRINSSKAEAAQAGMCCSGFIPIEPSSVIRIKNITVSGTSSPYMFFYKADRVTGEGTWTSKVADYMTSVYDSTTGVYTLDLTASGLPGNIVHTFANYLRISFGNINENTIVTCNEEITESSGGGTVIEYEWVNTGLAFVPANYEDRILALEAKIAELEA